MDVGRSQLHTSAISAFTLLVGSRSFKASFPGQLGWRRCELKVFQ